MSQSSGASIAAIVAAASVRQSQGSQSPCAVAPSTALRAVPLPRSAGEDGASPPPLSGGGGPCEAWWRGLAEPGARILISYPRPSTDARQAAVEGALRKTISAP